ncbi:hypothetical protein [Micromonospora sp. NPDC126480]|uniref:hypothetical protein n=1 Tax=Micromonospora sp. NPDC126480 TaxID=3155312 RepID=UPI003332F538
MAFRFARAGVVTAVTAAIVALAAPPASAYTSDDLYLFRSSNDCLWGQAVVDWKGTAGIASDVANVSSSWAWYPPMYCAWLYDRPAGWLATSIQNWKWNGSSWYLCRDSGFLYNRSQSASNSYTWKLGIACGTGWSGTMGQVFVWRDNSWQGGSVWSGAERFTIISGAGTNNADAADVPPLPAWVMPDGTVDVAKLPETVGVVGPDGRPTGQIVNPKELAAPPLLSTAPGPRVDPPGVVRTSNTVVPESGPQYTVEKVTLTDVYRGRLG